MSLTNHELQSAYRTFNRKYFGKRLPDVWVSFGVQKKHILGSMRHFRLVRKPDRSQKKRDVFTITISRKLRPYPVIAMATLLHEMVHVENHKRRGHGRWFDRRMLRLAKAGALNGLW